MTTGSFTTNDKERKTKVRNKIWKLHDSNHKEIDRVVKEHGISEILATLLVHRGLVEPTQVNMFLNPDRSNFYDPFLMKDLKKSALRIIEAIKNNEMITIYGDYDVDGVTSTSCLYLYLKELGANVDYYIPDRVEEGYGLNNNAIIKIAENGTKLVVTVDTGITAVEQAELAKELGLDLIITDHHECQSQIPDAFSVVNPKQETCNYPFDMLAGVGVTFKLIQGLAELTQTNDLIWKYLDLVAVGTIADIVPLKDENRIIAKLAFETIPNTWNIGLKALMDVAGIKTDKMTSGIVGFQIAPRLNAAGRLGDAKKGVELFTTKDEHKANEIAHFLNLENQRRQTLEQEIFKQSIKIIEAYDKWEDLKVLVVAGEGWNHGVIGIVASRIVERYYRPTIVLTIEEGIASGSARSVESFSIFDALSTCKPLLEKFGGHEMAAGMSLKVENIDALREQLNQYATEVMDETTLIPKLYADMTLQVKEVNVDLIESLKTLEPYGMGNEEPKFILKGNLLDIKTIGKESNHLKIQLIQDKAQIEGIGFNMHHYNQQFGLGSNVETLASLSINEWQGRKFPQLLMKDLAFSEEYQSLITQQINIVENLKKMDSTFDRTLCMPNRSHFEQTYRNLILLDKMQTNEITLSKWVEVLKLEKIEMLYLYILCLEVFNELELVKYRIENNLLIFELSRGKKVELSQSKLYNKWVG